jgi:hypothetical protein
MLSTAVSRRAAALPGGILVIGVALALGYLVALAWAMENLSYDVWGAMVVGPVLVAISVPILARAARADGDPMMGKILFAAFAAKMVGALLRYAVTFEVYGGRADAGGYHGSGSRLAAAFWDGTWDRVLHDEVPELVGTEFMRLATGMVYIVTGPTKLGGFLVFGWLSFWGLFCFYRAFRTAFPEGDHRRYTIALFFLPSLLYWPSSIGKEAWMLFTLGIVAYGAALVLTYRTHGYVVLGIGLAATALVRPHVTLLAFVAFFVAYLVRRRSWRESQLGLLGRLIGLAVIVAAGVLIVTQTAHFFHLDTIDGGSVDQVLDRTVDQSSDGGSEFATARVTSPAEYPYATLSVLFRPFPWEAGNAQALAAAIEGVVVMALFIISVPRLVRMPGFAVRTPYVMFALAYTGLFILAFSAIGNFGLLARQRTQVLPFVLVLIAVPARAVVTESRARSRDSVTKTTRRPLQQLASERAVP